MGKLITIIEASRRLGLTEQTMRNWIRDGHFSVKTVGKARYLDEDTINALHDTVEDKRRAERYVNALCEEKRREAEWRGDVRDYDRILRFVSSLAVQSGFFSVVLELLNAYGELNERETQILKKYLYGEPMDAIGEKYGLTRERVRQIVEKAIRKSRSLMTLREKIDGMKALQAENEALKSTFAKMQERLAVYEQPKDVKEERRDELERLCGILSTKIVTCNLSIRALNCLKAGRTDRKFTFGKLDTAVVVPECKTIGDVCRLQKTDYLKIRNAGKKSLIEIDEFLKSLGLDWGMDVDSIYQEYALLKTNFVK